MDLGNGMSCKCPGPFHIPRPAGPAGMTSGMMVVNVIMVVVTAGLWLIPLFFHMVVAASTANKKLLASQQLWDMDHTGTQYSYLTR